MNDLLIGNLTRYTPDKIHNWVQSAKEHFQGKILIIGYDLPQETLDYLKNNEVEVVITQSLGYHIVVQRFLDIYTYLSQNKGYRYVIVTDVKDVYFQKDPANFLHRHLIGRKKIVVGSEGILYKDEDWGRDNLSKCYPHLYEFYKDKKIYNAGTFAGEASYIRDLAFYVFHLSLVGLQFDPQPDQAAFNIILGLHPWKDVTEFASMNLGWCAQLGTTLDPKIKDKYKPLLKDYQPEIHDNKIYTAFGELFYLVHQYDRIPNFTK
jgi:hypothetical protein